MSDDNLKYYLTNKSYLVHIFCLTSEYVKPLIPVLLEQGYKVSSGLTSKKNFTSKGITSIISLILDSNKSSLDIHKDLKEALLSIKAYYYGFIIFPAVADSFISIGNIDGETDISRVIQMKALW